MPLIQTVRCSATKRCGTHAAEAERAAAILIAAGTLSPLRFTFAAMAHALKSMHAAIPATASDVWAVPVGPSASLVCWTVVAAGGTIVLGHCDERDLQAVFSHRVTAIHAPTAVLVRAAVFTQHCVFLLLCTLT